MTRKRNFFLQLSLIVDVAIMLISYLAAYWEHRRLQILVSPMLPIFSVRAYLWILPVVLLSWLFAMRRAGLYDATTYRSPLKILVAMSQSQVLAALILISTLSIMKGWGGVSRSLLGLLFLNSFIGLLMEKLAVYMLMKYRWLLQRPTAAWRVLVVGDRADAERYLDLIGQHPDWNLKIVGIVAGSVGDIPERNGYGDLHTTT